MTFYARFSVAFPATVLSGFLGWMAISSPAIAAPYDQLEQQCEPKFSGSHDCLEPVPAYSYHLGLRSNYSGEICVGLGDWEGKNKVVMEWDGLQTELQLTGKTGVNQLLQPEQREGRSSAIVVYSDQPIMPRIIEQDCGRDRNANHVTVVAWPQDTNETQQDSLAQLPKSSNFRGSELSF